METIVSLLENPVIAGAIVALLTAVLPGATITKLYQGILAFVEKTPLVGALVKIVRLYYEKAIANQVNAKVQAASDTARVLVDGAEQLKDQGKLDGATAAAQITQALVTGHNLDSDTARKVTEQAVRDMHRSEAFYVAAGPASATLEATHE